MGMAMLVLERPYEGANGALFAKFHARRSRLLAPSICSLESTRSMRMTMFEGLLAHDAWLWLVA